jgi:hypothetical protein
MLVKEQIAIRILAKHQTDANSNKILAFCKGLRTQIVHSILKHARE